MRRLLVVLALVGALTLALGGLALAESAPVRGCPDNFELHHMHPMVDDEPTHHDIGNDADKNGDGYLCMKQVGKSGNNHVHIDNNVPCEPDPARCVVVPH